MKIYRSVNQAVPGHASLPVVLWAIDEFDVIASSGIYLSVSLSSLVIRQRDFGRQLGGGGRGQRLC